MKISKKKALELACWEYEIRHGEWEPLEDDPDWTLEDEIKKEGYEHWVNTPGSILATMMYDGLFYGCTSKEISKYKRFVGVKIWNDAEYRLIIRDHDT